MTRKPALLLVTGADHPDAAENLEILHELTEVPWPLYSVSGIGGQGLGRRIRAADQTSAFRLRSAENVA